MDQHYLFQALLKEGHPLFLTFNLAAPLVGAPSEGALRQAYRRGKCPIRVDFSSTGALGFSLANIVEFIATGEKQKQPILVRSVKPVQAKAKRGAPTKAQRIAKAAQEGDQHD